MNRRFASRLSIGSLLFGAALVPMLSFASSKYDKSKEPMFLEPRPDRAVLYIARTEAPKINLFPSVLKVFLDTTPVGYLRNRSYLAAYVEPGTRLLWGPDPGEPLWVELAAGKTYMFRLDELWRSSGANGLCRLSRFPSVYPSSDE